MEKRRERTAHGRAAQGLRWLLAGAAALLLANPAWAAVVKDVRTGQHPGFSRVVFELDQPVGYKVERTSPSAGVTELVVSLDAAARSQTVNRRKLDFVESVTVQGQGMQRSTVRIRLKGDDLKLKEMILANPPRIVLDVLDEGAMASARAAEKKAAARKAQAAANTKAAAQKAQAAAQKAQAAAQKAKEQAAREAEAKAQAAAQAKAAEEKAAAELAAAEAAREAEVEEVRAAAREDARLRTQAMPEAPASLPQAGEDTAGAEPQQLAMADTPGGAKPNRAPGMTIQPGATPPAPKPAANGRPSPDPEQAARMAPPKPAAASAPATEGLFSLTNLTAGAVGLLLLLGAVFVFMRRRNAAEVVDASAFENPLGEDNPFADLEPGAEQEENDPFTSAVEAVAEGSPEQAELGIEIPEAEPVTDEQKKPAQADQEGTNMDMASDNSTTIMNTPPAVPMGGGADVSQMVAEFERRMKAMETRIDELVDAKERLERQVAAQTEELRVQRAAIARTQRAVRNLSRPGEDSPTEPALRDPARPEGPRQ